MDALLSKSRECCSKRRKVKENPSTFFSCHFPLLLSVPSLSSVFFFLSQSSTYLQATNCQSTITCLLYIDLRQISSTTSIYNMYVSGLLALKSATGTNGSVVIQDLKRLKVMPRVRLCFLLLLEGQLHSLIVNATLFPSQKSHLALWLF